VWCGGRRRLTVRNGSSDLKVFEQHFARREMLDIPFGRVPADILDLGANVGISVEVFRRLFPAARIIAVELDEQNARLCRLNHQSDEMITVVHAAIWSESRLVSVKDVGNGPWALQVEPSTLSSALDTVPALTYDEILSLHGLRFVDVMKMDIEGAEADVLEASWETIFGCTAVSIIEIHHWLDGIEARIDRVLEKARTTFELDISRSGEFWIIRNAALAGAAPVANE
jgi:FkbM family methyltransferase